MSDNSSLAVAPSSGHFWAGDPRIAFGSRALYRKPPESQFKRRSSLGIADGNTVHAESTPAERICDPEVASDRSSCEMHFPIMAMKPAYRRLSAPLPQTGRNHPARPHERRVNGRVENRAFRVKRKEASGPTRAPSLRTRAILVLLTGVGYHPAPSTEAKERNGTLKTRSYDRVGRIR